MEGTADNNNFSAAVIPAVEAKDPASGPSYYCNESTGKNQWEMPNDTPLVTHSISFTSVRRLGGGFGRIYRLLQCFNFIQFKLYPLEGPLFQQRPYPSPGAVLRKNAEVASQTKISSSRYTSISKRGDDSDAK
ncbi:hypothetical protein NC652_036041 [Populus alba x Populus x berolinensis]|nr:hypothetical protein NC652_036041 [Populus alba x Populus x berolinensis]